MKKGTCFMEGRKEAVVKVDKGGIKGRKEVDAKRKYVKKDRGGRKEMGGRGK